METEVWFRKKKKAFLPTLKRTDRILCFKYLLLTWRCAPCWWYGETFVATVEESKNVTAKYVTDVFHPADSCSVRLYGPVGHVERGVHHRQIVLFGGMLEEKKKDGNGYYFEEFKREIFWNFVQIFGWNTKYLSVATDTRIRSSPTRTFSPSDLCFDAGWTVHQQASPKSIVSDVCVLWKHDRNWYRFILLNSIAFHRLTLRMLLEAHVESQLVVGRAGR